MTEIMVQISIEILDILATVTKEMKQSRASGRADGSGGWAKEARETDERRGRMASVQIMKVMHKIDIKVTGIDDGVRGVDETVQVVNNNAKAVDDKVQTIADDGNRNRNESETNPSTNGGQSGQREAFVSSPVFADSRVYNTTTGCQLRESLGKWQSSPDSSTNHNIAGDRKHKGTAGWFFESNRFENRKVTGSLLWAHGKPGSGKTVL
ncbi:hypothetical protein EDB84DRAFT_970970 [Lactarius hengduanensis]|nr:hypothetical protein EDB84DRAFT_970970 [Lactarius hengduanensis]